ncbi:MAG TPA: RNA 2',3'-cyclic phosphodiesterase [Terracidiphilus sp.]|nr:RNA 2',3'-cyclic phosphodiesterase [Terracidiphilus sp.]
MRLFVGIPLADAARNEIAAVMERLRGSGEYLEPNEAASLRWSAPDSWHITLQFLGNATEEQLECLKARLGEVRAAPVTVKLGELGSFERVGVLFAEVAVTKELAALQRSVMAATANCGFVAEARPFHPHITLARKAREQRSKRATEGGGTPIARAIQGFIKKRGSSPRFTPFTAGEFVLYESHLGEGPARYEARLRVALRGGGNRSQEPA